MKLIIKNMICERCKVLVREELERLGFYNVRVKIGEVELDEKLSLAQYDEFKYNIQQYGLQLVEDKKRILIERVKNAILEMINNPEDTPKTKFSCYLSALLDHDYTYIANLFSDHEGITIEQYVIANKIERVKEMILYDDLTITEIAYRLHYSSVAHLSNQFKKITGLPPSLFKAKRSALVHS